MQLFKKIPVLTETLRKANLQLNKNLFFSSLKKLFAKHLFNTYAVLMPDVTETAIPIYDGNVCVPRVPESNI